MPCPLSRSLPPHDWNLPNHELTRIWQTNYGRVVRLRKQAGNPAPKWDCRRDWTRDDPAFQAAVRAEEERAEAGGQRGAARVGTRWHGPDSAPQPPAEGPRP